MVKNELEPRGLKIWKLEDGSLVLKEAAGRRVLLGPPRRALPLTDPERWILFLDADGAEVGVLRAVDDLDEASQTVLREALRSEYRLEKITRVLAVEREPLSGQTRWRVELAPDEDASVEAAPVESASTSDGDESKGRARAAVASFLSRDKAVGEVVASGIEREFAIAGQEDVQTARYPHIFIVDTERRRYEIINCEALDTDSRKAAERFF